jgi:uncharacterized protein
MGIKPVPHPDDATRPYWDYARQRELRVQRCLNCGMFRHPPTLQCDQCSSADVDWVLLSGKATIYSFIIDHRLMVPGFDRPYIVIQATPVEVPSDRVRIVANLNGTEATTVHIGMDVEIEFEVVSADCTLPQFRPSPSSL